jgi:hypothetical protein
MMEAGEGVAMADAKAAQGADSGGSGRPDLTAKQERVAVLLASGRTIVDAAGEAKVGERTIKEWLADRPAFARRVQQLRSELTERALSLLSGSAASAAETLAELLGDEAAGVRLRAAQAVFDSAVADAPAGGDGGAAGRPGEAPGEEAEVRGRIERLENLAPREPCPVCDAPVTIAEAFHLPDDEEPVVPAPEGPCTCGRAGTPDQPISVIVVRLHPACRDAAEPQRGPT